MKTVPRNLGLIVLGVLVAAPAGVIFPGFSDSNPTADATRLNAEEHTEAGTAWVNVRTFGAQGDGLSDDTIAIQKAIDGAYASKGNVVFFPSGIYVVSQIILRLGISLSGSGINPPPHGLGTILQQKPGTDLDLIVSDQPPPRIPPLVGHFEYEARRREQNEIEFRDQVRSCHGGRNEVRTPSDKRLRPR